MSKNAFIALVLLVAGMAATLGAIMVATSIGWSQFLEAGQIKEAFKSLAVVGYVLLVAGVLMMITVLAMEYRKDTIQEAFSPGRYFPKAIFRGKDDHIHIITEENGKYRSYRLHPSHFCEGGLPIDLPEQKDLKDYVIRVRGCHVHLSINPTEPDKPATPQSSEQALN